MYWLFIIILYTLIAFKVLGENVHSTNEDGCLEYELGVIYFMPQRNKEKYKKMEDWWLLEIGDVIRKISPPTEERFSGKRIFYKFSF